MEILPTVTVRETLPRILGLRELALKIKDDSYSVDPEENDSNTSEYVIKHFKGNDFRNDLPADIVFHKVDIPGKHVVYIYSYPLILFSELLNVVSPLLYGLLSLLILATQYCT